MTHPRGVQEDGAPQREAAEQGDPPLNRAERRAQARGKGRTSPRRQDNLMTMEENDAATVQREAPAGTDAPPEATAGDTRMTGAGTGGATESGGRIVEHEGKDPEPRG